MNSYDNLDWYQKGFQHIWHPYTQMQTAPHPFAIKNAENVWIEFADGQKVIDAISCWWVMCHGHNHPYLKEAIKRQLEQYPHMLFADIANRPAYELATRLCKILPQGLSRVFFSDSGSVAVEVAMKMAVQYWFNLGKLEKSKFIYFKGGYHGDTMGSMSISGPGKGLHSAFAGYGPEQYMLTIPSNKDELVSFEHQVKNIASEVAALFIEPLVQCVAGMRFHDAEILRAIYLICKKYNILFVADEIATGFGRTGKMFACEEAEITPDIICLGKALTGGMLTLAATVATEEIFAGFLSDDPAKAFMHGPTYMANPLACAVANASLDLFEREPRLQQVANINSRFSKNLATVNKYDFVVELRAKGAIIAIELQNVGMKEIRTMLLERQIYTRPIGNILYLMPPFIIKDEEIDFISEKIVEIFYKVSKLHKYYS